MVQSEGGECAEVLVVMAGGGLAQQVAEKLADLIQVRTDCDLHGMMTQAASTPPVKCPKCPNCPIAGTNSPKLP